MNLKELLFQKNKQREKPLANPTQKRKEKNQISVQLEMKKVKSKDSTKIQKISNYFTNL